jgi:dephospho-CoA kinase
VNKLIIGLTGGIGSGKSTVAKLFAAKGITVVDADQCSRIVVEPGQPALLNIEARFGKTILLPDGTLDRAQLRKIIFESPSDKQWLEQLLHPLIFTEILRQLEIAPGSYAILESPLLIEAGQSALCHRTLVVDATEEEQIKRAIQRDNNSRELIEAIMKTQAKRSERLAKADDLIDNNGEDLQKLEQQVSALHQQYLKLGKAFVTHTN